MPSAIPANSNIRLILDEDLGTIEVVVNGENKGVAFSDVTLKQR